MEDEKLSILKRNHNEAMKKSKIWIQPEKYTSTNLLPQQLSQGMTMRDDDKIDDELKLT